MRRIGDILRVRRFGGSRRADPPAWGIKTGPRSVYLIAGVPAVLIGEWWLDVTGWDPADIDNMPDDVARALAEFTLTRKVSASG